MVRRILLALCILVLVSENAPAVGRVPTVPLGQDFVLHVGQAVTVDGAGFLIAFVAVLEDSRCPVDVTCIWAGNAKVELQIREADDERQRLVLNTELEPTSAMIGRYELRLIALTPVPHVGVPVPESEYAATLRVSET